MDDQAATLNAGGDQPREGKAEESQQGTQSRPIAMKFSYPSGSCPLEGYTIKRGIGVGGFGEVYFATSDAGKEVALKHIQRNLDVELRGVSQCLNLKHPNLVALFDIRYDPQGDGWVVMEYLTGESLKSIIDAYPNGMPIEQVRFWFSGITAGTAYLHDHGIVHRDLKPGNIFMDEGVVKIGDYGLSKFISVSRRSGQTESVGTFHYMAPEIGKGVYGKEIDVYALGVVLYEMLTGNVPFDGESSQEIIMKHLTDEPDLSGLPAPFNKVVARALTKDPKNRYSSIADMTADLELDLPIVATVVGAERTAAPADTPARPAGVSRERIERFVQQVEPAQSPTHPSAQMPVSTPVRTPAPRSSRRRKRQDLWHKTSTPMKVVLVLAAVFLLLSLQLPVVPTVVLMLLAFMVFQAVRASVAGNDAGAPTATSAPMAHRAAAVKHRQRRMARSWQEQARLELIGKPPRQQLTELLGSMLMSTLVAAVLGVIMLAVSSQNLSTSISSWGPVYAWVTLTTVVGAWTILAASKLWEGRKGDQSLRRFTMLVIGLAVGASAYGLSQAVLVQPTYLLAGHSALSANFPDMIYAADGTPNLLAYMGYFAGLFVVIRFWKQGDPLRNARLSLWATTACVLWALLLHLFWPLPRGFMVAATISIAVQLSAPWLDYRQRSKIRKETQEAWS